MSHENILASLTGQTLKGKAFYNNAGSMAQRGANFDFTEFGTHGLYTGDAVAGQVASDIILAYRSTDLTNPIAQGEYLPAVTVNNISAVQAGVATETKQDTIIGNFFPDEVLDPAAGTIRYNKKGTLTQLSKKDLIDPGGDPVDSTEDIIAGATEQ